MTATTLYTGSPEDLKAMLAQVVEPLAERIRELEVQANTHKHAYKVAEAAEKIGYSRQMIHEFIKNGRKDAKGRVHRLRHKEVTTGDYRILPAYLDEFLSHF
ncbi:hypothetical protein GCM10028807_60300 [Spirosoma daeguense]